MEKNELMSLTQDLMNQVVVQSVAIQRLELEQKGLEAQIGIKEYELNGARKQIHALEQELKQLRDQKKVQQDGWIPKTPMFESYPPNSLGPTGSKGMPGPMGVHVNSLGAVGTANGNITTGTITANNIKLDIDVGGYIRGFVSNRELMKRLGIKDLSEELAEEPTSKRGLHADLGQWEARGSITSYQRDEFGSFRAFK